MIRFNNDYNCGTHPEILKALERTNMDGLGGYGMDDWCKKASVEIKKYLDCPKAEVHFLVGGTQTNYIVIASALRPYEGVISANTGHIFVHETGAIENCGHKVIALPSTNGKISAKQVEQEAKLYETSGIKEHITQPKMVYISFPTEYGTIYTKQELLDLRAVCDQYHLSLFIDGARLGYGLGADNCDVTVKDIAKIADAFYFGGTKCGALFGEAVVLTRPELFGHFRAHMKQNGALLAKGWLLGVQFYTLFQDGLYFEITKNAVSYALQIKEAFAQKGIPSFIESPTNQQFFVLNKKQMEQLGEHFIFEYDHEIDEEHSCVRFCTSWSTKEEDIKALISAIQNL